MPTDAETPLVAEPEVGRLYTASRLVRFGDLSPGGRLRLDALGRYLQDVSGDDTADAGYRDLVPWVVRRLVVEVHGDAGFRERLTLRTWCSGIGGRWAERRVSLHGDRGAHLEAASLWVHVDPETGQPHRLEEDFLAIFGTAAAGRRVGARLRHDPRPPEDAERCRWPLRFSDFDPLRHVNNAVYLAMVEEVLADRRELRAPWRVEVEFRAGIVRDERVELAARSTEVGSLGVWVLRGDGEIAATARVRELS